MFRTVVVTLACIGLSGCADTFMSAPDKVNKAFPPIAEVRIAEDGLRTLLQPDAAATKVFERQYASRLELRAMICGQAVTVGRFDSIAKVKGYPINRECLNEQDTQLLQYLGIRQIGLRLAQPALRPLLPLGAAMTVPMGGGPEIYSAHVASRAGVAVLTGTRGELVSVEIPGGKKIATLASAPSLSNSVLVSPNGRVAAVRLQLNNIMFVDTETGSKLWETKDLKQFYGWMPELSAALAADAKGVLALIDFQAGTVAAHPVALREPAWAVSISPSRMLIGSGRLFSLLEHARDGLAFKASMIKELQVKQGQGVTSSPPTLMQGGKTIVYTSSRELMAMSLESGAETSWPGELFVGRYAKLSESTLLVETIERAQSGLKTYVFNIDNATLAPVATGEAGNGSVMELAGRTGFVRKGYQELWFGDSVEAGNPVTLGSLVNALNLTRQIARLEAATQESARDDQGRSEAWAIAAPSGSIITQSRAAPIASTGAGAGQDAILTAHARVARIEAVGVYQGSAATGGTQGRKIGHAEVRVRRGKPIILVLSSYEPVRWKVVQEPGAVVLSVLLSGYHQSEVSGAGRARVVTVGSNYAYEAGSAQHAALNRQIGMYTGKGIESFQGKYEGSQFTVGGE